MTQQNPRCPNPADYRQHDSRIHFAEDEILCSDETAPNSYADEQAQGLSQVLED
jgi:hypothetical protein